MGGLRVALGIFVHCINSIEVRGNCHTSMCGCCALLGGTAVTDLLQELLDKLSRVKVSIERTRRDESGEQCWECRNHHDLESSLQMGILFLRDLNENFWH